MSEILTGLLVIGLIVVIGMLLFGPLLFDPLPSRVTRPTVAQHDRGKIRSYLM